MAKFLSVGMIALALLTRTLRFHRLRQHVRSASDEQANEEALGDPESAEVGDRVARPPPP